ncbi:retropepsin-like aspartic protease family protein [Rhodalgimonas zhirmunskyi]|uniref:TIGR02281 family clan AA aspartic protease n=1 Tax=Rhodalgimonas zhirmunskyi TaxID=2964767 RepID=A0AAJ1U3U9_9RHOB|nr:TIGR02281 family clan AA aspartic protease [Rhodoalgimonas zhirmunskyi]MDQ2093211.1 TIGR02281 family clan AA aspartic protease [Rhodoalgimonas zhirmunskyi]
MTNDYASLTYLVLLLSAIAFWFFVQNRASLSKLLQQALAWGLIFMGAIAIVALWDDIKGAVVPQQSVFAEEGRIVLPRARDGHYYVTADVNGAKVRFTVDTGATGVVLTQADAEKAGIDTGDLAYIGRAYTANGEVRTAPVTLEEFSVDGVHDRNLRAFVNEGPMDGSLLGMSYLQRFSDIRITDGALTLQR